jgi:hypothetical protein
MKQLWLVLFLVCSVSRGVLADAATPPTQPAAASVQTLPAAPDAAAAAAVPAATEVLTPPPAAMPGAAPARASATPPIRTRSIIQLELRALEQQRRDTSLALPIGLLIGGGGAAVNGVVFVLMGALFNNLPLPKCETTQACDLKNKELHALATAYILTGAIAGGVGAVLLIIGGIVMADRSGRRRELGNRIFDLRRELEFSVAGLSMSVAATPNGAGLQLRF